MSAVHGVAGPIKLAPKAAATNAVLGVRVGAPDILPPDELRADERFIPITRFALVDRLTKPELWPNGQARQARRFFQYLDYWRQQQYNARILQLEQDYEPFSPDTDLLLTRTFTPEERLQMQRRVVDGIRDILHQANYVRIDPAKVDLILTKDSHYGLDLHVDLDAFEELLIFYRGASTRKNHRRLLRTFMRKQEFDVPVFQRLFVLFKMKPDAQRVSELMAKGMSQRDAERQVKRLRALLPPALRDDNIYMKLFKNIPRSDIEMAFPNTEVRFRLFDKIKLGVTGSAGLGVGVFSAAGKLALAVSNPIAAAGAAVGLGGIAFRQAINFMNQRQRYMVVMAQNLYFHSMADNRGVMIKLADRAAEEDVKEEILLYTVLAKTAVNRGELKQVDRAIEDYLQASFSVSVDFDVQDALSRLIADGLVREDSAGQLITLGPEQAAQHIDSMWDSFLDNLGSFEMKEGIEMERAVNGAPQPLPTPPSPGLSPI